jgi:hypothetical protein
MGFAGETQYLWNFIASFLVVDAPLHAITSSAKIFQSGKNQKKDQKNFEVDTYASGYAMGED